MSARRIGGQSDGQSDVVGDKSGDIWGESLIGRSMGRQFSLVHTRLRI